MDSLILPSKFNTGDMTRIRYMDTTTAYDLWSEVYDTDGNFLQALDTIQMKSLFPRFLAEIPKSLSWKLVDLGCGTGRNTSALLKIPNSEVVGLDASLKMLEVARNNLEMQVNGFEATKNVSFAVYDLLGDEGPPDVAIGADGVISTLVIEHVPLPEYFNAVSRILKRSGIILVTNMHSDMGQISQAGFVDPRTGEKIRPKSYAHKVADVKAEAQRQGFELVGDVLERAVDNQTSEELGPRSRKWIGITVWFGMMFRKIV
jgi:SAM-dependent methyltransferase